MSVHTIELNAVTNQTTEEFLQRMVSRMDMGLYRYGPVVQYKGHQFTPEFLALYCQAAMGLFEALEKHKSPGTSGRVNTILSALQRIKLYLNGNQDGDRIVLPGNTEHLVDAANFLMIEYTYPGIFNARFSPSENEQK